MLKWLKKARAEPEIEAPIFKEASIASPTPPTPPTDWRDTGETRWKALKESENFVLERQQKLLVDMESGEEKWEDVIRNYGTAYYIWKVAEERVRKKSETSE